MAKELLKDDAGNPMIFKEFPLVCRVFPEYECNSDGTVFYDEDKCKGFHAMLKERKRLYDENKYWTEPLMNSMADALMKTYKDCIKE